jgi:hypothetical protein
MFGFGPGELVILVFVVPFFLALFFLPVVIAIARHHPSAPWIALLDLFLGWTLLGWLGALVWSLTPVAPTQAATQGATLTGTAGVAPTPGATRFCTRCGATLPPDAVFCPACGRDSRA